VFGTAATQQAQWSSYRQLSRAGLFSDRGLILGKKYGRLLCQNGPEHALIAASTQSGKTTCFVLPNLLTWDESILIHDPKEELYAATAGWRSTFSRVVHLAPTSSSSQGYNPLDAIRLKTEHEIRDAQLLSQALTDPNAQGSDKRSSASQHFTEMGAEAIGGLSLYGLYTQRARSLGALNTLVTEVGFKALVREMRRYPHAGIRRAAAILMGTDGKDESSSIFSTATRPLRLYTDPLVARMTDRSDFSLRDLRERARPMSLYLSIPFGDQERLRGWTRLVLRQLFDYAVHRKEGWSWKLLCMIDEVPGLKRFNMLTDGLNYFAGYGVRLALITPSMEELIETYGTHHNFLEGCKIKVVFGQEDAKVAEVFSQRVGSTEVSRTRQVGRQRVREQVKEPLLSATALTNLGRTKQLVIVGQHKVLARKTYYKENAVWAARSAL
jgi:type IV secretion system protein VirD4